MSQFCTIKNLNKYKQKSMEHQELFNYYENFDLSARRQVSTYRNAALNPWSQNQLANPFLHMKDRMPKIKSNTTSLKKISERKKMMSLNQQKSVNNLTALNSKQYTEPNKISKELPKLNIGQLMKHQTLKKKKITQNFSKRFALNSSPLYFSSPTLNKFYPVHNSSELNKKAKVLPSVSRQLELTRKIYMLENKMNSMGSPSPKKKIFRQEGDIRRLVEKQWSKKI